MSDHPRQNSAQCQQALALAIASNCPADTWMDRIAPLLARPYMAFVNVGANKGYNVNAFLQRFQHGWSTSAEAWRREMVKASGNNQTHHPGSFPFMCGVCAACLQPSLFRKIFTGSAQVEVLAVEMQPATHQALATVFATFRVPGKAVWSAASDDFGTTTTSWDLKAGTEDFGIGSWRGKATRNVLVRVATVDSLVGESRLRREVIDVLSIDTEGSDALVLRGAETTLAMARVVEFEYHRVGAWGNLSLWDTLSYLRLRWRYRCYWQGDFRHSGALVPIDERCSSNLPHFWSNVVCAKDHDILQIFNDMLPDYMGGLWKTMLTRKEMINQTHPSVYHPPKDRA